MGNEAADPERTDEGRAGSVAGGVGVLLGVVVFALLVMTGAFGGGDIPFGSGSEPRRADAAENAPSQPVVRPARPTTLAVPSVDIEADVRPVRLDEDRVLEPPRQPELVGWWNESAAAGSTTTLRGSTVIAGHTVHDAGEAGGNGEQDGAHGGGAMDRLPEVAKGARVVVRTENGAVRYRVGAVKHFSTDELAERAETLFDQQRDHRLLLVTCEDWNGEEYRSNVVIVAHPLPAAA